MVIIPKQKQRILKVFNDNTNETSGEENATSLEEPMLTTVVVLPTKMITVIALNLLRK